MKKFLGIIAAVLLGFAFDAKAVEYLTITQDEIADAIKKEFIEQGHDDNIDLEFYGGQTTFMIENKSQGKILVSNLKLDELQNKFSCKVEIFADGSMAKDTDIQGKYYVIADVWVPSTNISKGEVITEKMVKRLNTRMNRIKPQNIIDKDKIVGKEAKRPLKEGKIISDRDIGTKIVIKKGEVVNMMYVTNSMQIAAKVEALSNGSAGERIEVMNIKSKKVVTAEVIDSQTVRVDADF